MLIRLCCLVVALAWASMAGAQSSTPSSRCADCHFAHPEAPGQRHLFEWDRSPHGQARVGCESCHGGNATTFEPFVAHREMLPPEKATSPLHRTALPRTCGRCHAGPFVSFQKSAHYDLLRSGDRRAPTCATCHGEVDGRLLSAKALESQCSSCHGPGETAPRAGRARDVRLLYEGLRATREEMKLARSLIKRIDDRQRRAALDELYQQAEVPLTEAINAGHQFVYDQMRERLDVARQRAAILLEQLTTPRAGR